MNLHVIQQASKMRMNRNQKAARITRLLLKEKIKIPLNIEELLSGKTKQKCYENQNKE